jgi:hypothetical protein
MLQNEKTPDPKIGGFLALTDGAFKEAGGNQQLLQDGTPVA